jgi:hypothetical protein
MVQCPALSHSQDHGLMLAERHSSLNLVHTLYQKAANALLYTALVAVERRLSPLSRLIRQGSNNLHVPFSGCQRSANKASRMRTER